MIGRWRRVEKMPIALGNRAQAAQRYIIMMVTMHAERSYEFAASWEEAQSIAARLRHTDAQIVTIARVEDAWKRQ